MSKNPSAALCALPLVLMLAACGGGQGSNDTLVDGAVDRAKEADTVASAQDVGPPSAATAAGGPASARTDGTTYGETPAGAMGGTPAAGGATLMLATQGAHGPHLTDSAGVALYHLQGDRDGSGCTADCATAWPPVLAAGVQPSGAPGLQGGMISTTSRPDGARQVTYNGHPLYRHAADGGAGNTKGHGLKDRYGTWHLVTAQGTPVAAAHGAH